MANRQPINDPELACLLNLFRIMGKDMAGISRLLWKLNGVLSGVASYLITASHTTSFTPQWR